MYSWRGATISVCGEAKGVYKSEMKEMKAYANLHGYLQQRREGLRAKGAARVRGPRVMIVGPADTGAFPAYSRVSMHARTCSQCALSRS